MGISASKKNVKLTRINYFLSLEREEGRSLGITFTVPLNVSDGLANTELSILWYNGLYSPYSLTIKNGNIANSAQTCKYMLKV